jgi:GTP-binding protein
MSGFVDEAQLHVKAGDGGAGAVSFRREAHVPKGGPDGGDGGKGGDVWLVAGTDVASLLGFRDHPHRRAENGTHGAGRARHGKHGADTVVKVPEGTVVKDLEGNVVADLVRAGERWLAAEGGRGGKGNARFLSNRRRAPNFAEQGEKGEELWFNLEIKLMADVALVGFPNAGKSTLISRISAAKPKIADYPFTTLEPNLGVVRLDDAEFVVADIPGLIEGASEGKGLGHRFLRHIERARALVVLLDLTADYAEQERILLHELGNYMPEMLERPRLRVGTKADVADPEVQAAFRATARGADDKGDGGDGGDDEGDGGGPGTLVISAVTGEGISPLLGRLAALVAEARATLPPPEQYVVHRPEPEGVAVERLDDGSFAVKGRQAERAVAVNDITNVQALAYVQGKLKSLGVDRALARAGAREGDLVRIAGFTFEYEPE